MYRHNYFCFACYLLLLVTAPLSRAQTAAQIDAIVLDEMARQGIVGMAVGIVKDGRVYHANGYGYADLARKLPVTANTVFRWASVSKTLTATAVLKLAEDNPRFSLDDRLARYVDYWPDHGRKGDIRIWQLLSHRAGIIHYRTAEGCRNNPYPDYSLARYRSRQYNARQAVQVFADQPLCFEPGTGFRYSTFGYSLLGAVIEGVSGHSYVDWVNRNIGEPLGMESLRQATAMQTGYVKSGRGLQSIADGSVAWRLPGGGWESSIVDLARFASALIQGELLTDTARLWTAVPGNRHYGFGLMHAYDDHLVWHEGSQVSGRAMLALFPKSHDRLAIVVLSNSADCEPMDVVIRLARLFL